MLYYTLIGFDHYKNVYFQFKNEKISQVACDNVLLLCDYIPNLLKHYPDIPSKVLEVIYECL